MYFKLCIWCVCGASHASHALSKTTLQLMEISGVAGLLPGDRTHQKVEDGTLSVFGPKHTVGKVDALPFRAAIGDRQAVSWWLSGPPGPESRSMTSDMGRE